MTKIKGISIRQPWADLVIRGAKTIELRERSVIELPDYLVIHAAKTVEYTPADFYGYANAWQMQRGLLLGVAKFEGIINIDEDNFLEYISGHRLPFPIDGGRVGIRLSMLKTFDKPIPFRGKLGFFDLTPEILELIQIVLNSKK